MTITHYAEITVRIPLDVPNGTDPARLAAALDDLSDVMMVQAEDGVYTGGNPDADDAEHVADVASDAVMSTRVECNPVGVPAGPTVAVVALSVPAPEEDDPYVGADVRAALRARLTEFYPGAGAVVPSVLSCRTMSPSAYRLVLDAALVGLDCDDPETTTGHPRVVVDSAWRTALDMRNDV